MKKNKIPVVFICSHTYITPFITAAKSLVISNAFWNEDTTCEDQLEINILVDELVTADDKSLISKAIDDNLTIVRFIEINDFFYHGYVRNDLVRNSLYRIDIPWLLPEYDKILYLDSDLIVNGDIRKIYKHAIGDSLFWGVRTPTYTIHDDTIKYIHSIGVDCNKYINGGVLIFNSKKQRLLDLKKEYPKYESMELQMMVQDLINIVANGDIGTLPVKYNAVPPLFTECKKLILEKTEITESEYTEVINHPIIVHWPGPKPWNSMVVNHRYWWDAFSRTILYDRKKELDYEIKLSSLRPPITYTPKTSFLIMLSSLKRMTFRLLGKRIEYSKF